MKTRIVVGLGAWLALMSSAGVARAALFNGSFESWNYVGWSLTSDSGNRAVEPFTRPAGNARTMSSWGEAFGLTTPIQAHDGHRFLAVNTRANANFLGTDSYDTFLSQTLSLNQGEVVSGWSFFFSGDAEPQDSAWVRVLDSNGSLLGAPWYQVSGSIAAAALPTSPWTQWQWSAPASGNYTIQLGMSTSGANNNASYGFFDGLMVQPTAPVPEPASMTLALVGGLALMVFRNRIR
jgi:hypothetical protein